LQDSVIPGKWLPAGRILQLRREQGHRAMDLKKVLAEMHEERKRLKAMIASLEAMQGTGAKPRGRRERNGIITEEQRAAKDSNEQGSEPTK
jgi:hypothetical protein